VRTREVACLTVTNNGRSLTPTAASLSAFDVHALERVPTGVVAVVALYTTRTKQVTSAAQSGVHADRAKWYTVVSVVVLVDTDSRLNRG